jgi:competence protein ComEA
MTRKPKSKQQQVKRTFRPLLDRIDQATVAGLALSAFVAMVGYWLVVGGHRGQLIEIDRAMPLEAQYVVDINSAEWPELAQLPSIGPTLAQRIVDSRLQDGPYQSHEDLLRVPGIGPVTLARMKPYLLPVPGENVARQD